MPFAAHNSRPDRRTRAFQKLIGTYLRLHSDLGWAGLFLLLLLFAANHENGWVTR